MPPSPPPHLSDAEYAAGARIVAVEARIRAGVSADTGAYVRLALATVAFVAGVVAVAQPGGVGFDLTTYGRATDHLAALILCMAVAFALLVVRPVPTAAKEAAFGPDDAAALRGYLEYDRRSGTFKLTYDGQVLRDRFERDHWHGV